MGGDGWYIQDATITGYTSATQTLATTYTNTNPAYKIAIGNEYYLAGIKGELDSPGEWFYDGTNSRLYVYSTAVPTNVVEAKKRDYGFNISGRAYINLTGLAFFGCTIQTDTNSATPLRPQFPMTHWNFPCTARSTTAGAPGIRPASRTTARARRLIPAAAAARDGSQKKYGDWKTREELETTHEPLRSRPSVATRPQSGSLCVDSFVYPAATILQEANSSKSRKSARPVLVG